MKRSARISAYRLGLVLVLCAGSLHAAEESGGAWGVVDLSGPVGAVGGPWNFAADIQARYFDLGTGISQWLVRPSVGYRVSNRIELRLGYGRFRARNRRGAVVNEDRPFQDLNVALGKPLDGNLDLRARLEQRFVDVSSEVSHVLRAKLRFRRPVGDALSIEAHYEAFYTLNEADWAGTARLAQWRIYLGAGRPVGSVRLEAGYMYQLIDQASTSDLGNHLAILRVGYRFGRQ